MLVDLIDLVIDFLRRDLQHHHHSKLEERIYIYVYTSGTRAFQLGTNKQFLFIINRGNKVPKRLKKIIKLTIQVILNIKPGKLS